MQRRLFPTRPARPATEVATRGDAARARISASEASGAPLAGTQPQSPRIRTSARDEMG
jgi:hypothetical protein